MPRIYRKVILAQETNIFYCENCLDKNNLPRVDWDDTIQLGNGNAGVWKEAPLEKCDVCFAVDLQAQEEMQDWSNDLDQQQWEEDQMPTDNNPQEYK